MLHKLILISAFLLFANIVSYACQCAEKPTVLEMFEGSTNVFTAKIASIESAPKIDQDGQYYVNDVKGAHAVVQKVYKGNVKPGDKVFFEQGGGADCVVTFKNDWNGKVSDETGEEFLVYYSDKLQNIRLVYCGRLGDKEDFSYLDNLDKLRGKTRFSGWYMPWIFAESNALADTRGKAKIRIVGKEGKEYVTTVDDGGFFEIYDIPPGKYVVKPDMPKGFAIDRSSLQYSNLADFRYLYEVPELRKELKKEGYDLISSFPLEIKPGGHTRFDFNFAYHNPIRIKVLDFNGRPVKGAEIAVRPFNEGGKVGLRSSDKTDEEGFSEIGEFAQGKYYIIVNSRNEIRAQQPFNSIYYPGVTEVEKASVIDIPAGGLKKLFIIRLPRPIKTYVLKGTLRYSDGSPVAEKYVNFVPSTKKKGYDYSSQNQTDKFGNFEIRVLADAKGYLKAEESIYESDFTKCSQLYENLKTKFSNGKTYFSIIAQTGQIAPKSNLSGLELRFPFNPCQAK